MLMQYTVKKLDRRFSLNREAGFELMLEWPVCARDYHDSVHADYLRTVKSIEQQLGMRYYKHFNPQGRWTETEQRVINPWHSRQEIQHKIFLRHAKHLTWIQLG